MKVVVLRFENKTKRNKMDSSSENDQLFGNGIKTQLITVLQQTGQFDVLNNAGPRKVLLSRDRGTSGEIKAAIKERLGSLGDAEFLIAGAITTYQVSQESKTAGIDADWFFRESQAQTIGVFAHTAEKVFGALPAGSQDRVALELQLIDTKTTKTIDRTTVECAANDFGPGIGGMFGTQLVARSESMQTPMQYALRACAIKGVNWIADTGVAYRDGKISLTPAPAEPAANVGPKRSSSAKPKLRKNPVSSSRPEPPVSEQLEGSPARQGRPDQEPPLDEWGEKEEWGQ